MNWQNVIGSKVVDDLAWTLIDSLWQIALISLALFAILTFTRSVSANVRYCLCLIALGLCMAVPVATYIGQASTPARAPSANERASHGRELEENAVVADRLKQGGLTTAADPAGPAEKLITSVSNVQNYLPIGLPLLVALWLAGVTASAFRLVGGIGQVAVYRRRSTSEMQPEWLHRFGYLCRQLNVTQRVRLVATDLLKTPVAVGVFKPMVLVPASVLLQMPAREIEMIIAHELVHIRRYDPLVNMLQSVVESILFYHPGVWWIARQVRREREFATDAAVLELCHDSHIVYASALANLEAVRQSADFDRPRLAAAADGGNLMQRIQRILHKKTEISSARSAWSAFGALALISAVLLGVFSFSSRDAVNAQDAKQRPGRKLAIGFVSIPPVDRSPNPPHDATATAKILIGVLRAHSVPAIGFVNGSQISDGERTLPVRAEIVKMWRDQGLEVGIGSFKHQWFYETPYDDYVNNVAKNESVVRKLLGDDAQLRYFSYPFLNTGKSNDEHQRFEGWLTGRGLASVKYTVDNNEWMYSYAYDMARLDNDLNTMKEIRTSFLEYMARMLDHFEQYSREMFGRDIPQTMVLTPSRLVADSGDELFGMIEKRGYRFVSMDQAQSDPAYQTDEDFVGNSGISWFERWQMKQGKRLLDEPKVDLAVEKTWNEQKARTQKKN